MTVDLMESAYSLGTEEASAPSSGTLAEWFERASDRPAFFLWGKAHEGQPWPLHPLVCHMLDVAAVAAHLIARIISPALRDRLLACDPDRARAFRTVLWIIALHDLGKATPAFQDKREEVRALLQQRGFDLRAVRKGDRHHGDIGFWLLMDALVARDLSKPTARALARAVTAHHGEFPLDAAGAPEARQKGSERWSEARRQLVDALAALFGVGAAAVPTVGTYDHAFVMSLAGLTSVADWVGSMDEVFTYGAPPPKLESYWTSALGRAETALTRAGLRPSRAAASVSFAGLFPGYSPWPLHRAAEEVSESLAEPSLVIVEAPMGEGKTEAALLLASSNEVRANQHGFFIGLPTQATSNQMFARTRGFLERTRPDETSTLLLAHGEASLVAEFERVRLAAVYGRSEGRVQAEAWFLSKKRALLAAHAVGTIDQALLGVLRVAHGFVRVFGLAGKTVILDEVHAYDTYTSKILDRLLEWLAAVGASVVLLSATLPSSRRQALAQAYARGRGLETPLQHASVAYPRLTVSTSTGTREHAFVPRRTPVEVTLDTCGTELDTMLRVALEATTNGGCAGILVNTVARAQEARSRLRALASNVDALLIHARMFPDERNTREERLADWLGPLHRAKSRPERAIVIGTQVLEQSLDVDFDVLVTDLAPIDLLLQRAGRLHRHDRPARPSTVRIPRLVIALGEDEGSLKSVAPMYSPLVLLRTIEALRGRQSVLIPTDIEPLVERVYDASAIPEAGSEYDAFVEHHGKAQSQANRASQKLLESPATRTSIFASFQVFLSEEDDKDLHAALRADTRDAEPSIEAVFVDEHEDGTLWADGHPLDLEKQPDRAMTQLLVRRSIGLSRAAVVRALVATKAPESWSENAVLRHRRLVPMRGSVASVGGVELRLDPELGLSINGMQREGS